MDVIISNCVINLSADKDRGVARGLPGAEARRPVRGFRCCVTGRGSGEIRRSVELWIGCIAGALTEDEYRKLSAGFADIRFEPTRIYRAEDAREFLAEKGVDFECIAPLVDGKFVSAFIRAIGIIGASAMRERNLVEDIILSLRFDGWSVSTIKRAPDGFDIDQPGKVSHRRREAGCREGDARRRSPAGADDGIP